MKCFHCQQKIINLIVGKVKNQQYQFCCSGCLTVCKIISDNNFDDFYQQKTKNITPIFNNLYPLAYYDLPDFKDEFVIDNKIILVSPAIHCAACVWLIEKALSKLESIISVRANLSNNRISIKLNKNYKLATIFSELATIGYGSEPLMENNLEIAKDKQNKALLIKIGFAGFAMMNLLWISVSLYSGADSGQYNNYFLDLSFIFATTTLFYSGSGFLKSSFFALKNFNLNMDVPISIGSLVTYFYSTFVLFGVVDGEIYFDTVVNFIFIILIGRYFEANARKSALSVNNSFASIKPKFATLIKNKKEIITAVKSLKKGDKVIIKTGERIAIDGVIISGNLSIDEAIITGEAIPIEKKINDKIFAGTINITGSAIIKIVKISKYSTINTIARLVEDANLNKAKIECLIDKIIPYFISTTIILAIFSFIYNYHNGFDSALISAVSILIITCPCAFGIAVPITNTIAASLLLKNKIIIKNNTILEKLPLITTVVFDKTGTLTTGEFTVKKIQSTLKKNTLLKIVASIAKFSNHPLAKSINSYYQGKHLKITDFSDKTGFGMQAKINEEKYLVGNYGFVSNNTKDNNLITGLSSVWCSKNHTILGSIYLNDKINSYAQKTINFLYSQKKHIILLSGDNKLAVKEVADTLKIKDFYYKQTPQDKINFIKKLQKNQSVLMVGDGVNDAPALALASCSIAIAGIDIASDNADVLIMKNNLSSIIKLWKVANFSKTVIKQNIIFALGYNIIFIPLAFLGLITPIFAAIVMPISSLIVILNALRLKNLKLK